MELSNSVTTIKGVGEKTAKLLEKLDVSTVGGLLYCLPRAYRDLSRVKKLNEVKIGETALFAVKIFTPPKTRRIRKGMEITSFEVSDESAIVNVDIFNQTRVKNYLHQGDTLYLYGKLAYIMNRVNLSGPELYFKKPEDPFLPIYPSTAGLSQTTLRKALKTALSETRFHELYSAAFLKRYGLPDIRAALRGAHFPRDMEQAIYCRDRIVFDELLVFCRMIELLGEETIQKNALRFAVGEKEVGAFLKRLPFAATGAQRRVMAEIASDLGGETYMNRLIQGDVGSGKTILAFFAMDCMAKNGCQSVMMAPTEILAEQHYDAAKAFFGPENVARLSGGLTARQKKEELRRIESGEAKIVIGTHALIYGDIQFPALGLLITDEQHRFGVKQRAALAGAGKDVHSLIMSATPIPRSLALVLYGKTDISIVDELPPGRKEIKTYLIRAQKYETMIGFIRAELEKGRQAYIVCPLIEEGGMEDVRSAQEVFGEVQAYWPDLPMELLHGRMKSEEKRLVMKRFAEGEAKVLVSTTVIEVGVNVPNASVMAIQNAERFGLAQLHQLRGRVGRGAAQSYCFLVSGNQNAYERLAVMVKTNDGFEIAEKDMLLRGTGDLLGTRQHGHGILKNADLMSDLRLLGKARNVLKALKDDPVFAREYQNITAAATQAMQQKMLEIAMN